MQYRPKLWLALLALLFVSAFEIGFQPIRVVRATPKGGETTLEYELGANAATGQDALEEKATAIRQQLEAAGLKAIQSVELVTPSRLRVSNTVLNEDQRTQDMALTLQTLQKEFKNASIAETSAQPTQDPDLVAKLGPIGFFRPVPHLRLGLDLQGGAHVVLQCKPSTEMTFATPEDRPLYLEEGDASEEGSTAEKAAEPTSEEPAPTEGAKGEETSPKAPLKAEPTEAKSAAAWNPKETKASLTAALEKLTAEAGSQHAVVSLPAPHRVLIKTESVSEDQVRQLQESVRTWLEGRYPGVRIDAPEPNSVFVTSDTAAKAKHIIDLRLFSMSDVKEPLVQSQGEDRIIVELPGVKEPQRVTKILQSTAQLEFRLVPKRYTPVNAQKDDYSAWQDSDTGQTANEARVLAESPVMFGGSDLQATSQVIPGETPGSFEVRFEIKESVKRDFAQFTRENVGNIMSIVLDGETKMAPVIRSEIPGVGVISGDMDAQEAGDLKLLLNAGALPVPLEIVENRQVSATLGADSIRQSVVAGLAGFVIVALFMLLYYRLPGLLANVALTLYVLILFASLSTWSPFQAIVTLPGIAGIILSIGMAVDANVIIFERLKEEMRHRTTTRAAAEAGFHRAWTAILDANVTTMMVCSALYFLGTSAVKSFAVSLFLGVVVSLFTAVTVSRWLVMLVARSKLGENRWLFGVAPFSDTAAETAGGSE